MKKPSLIMPLILILVFSLPFHVFAASTARLSKSAISTVEKISQGAEPSLRSKLNEQVKQIETLEARDLNLNEEIGTLHGSNGQKLASVQAQLKQLNSGKLEGLEKQVRDTKARYKPLFDLHGSLNKQLSAARKLKNKTLKSALQNQLDVVKVSAQLAREEIRAKEEALSAAKEAKTKTAKQVRSILEEVAVNQARINTEKKAAADTGKQIAAESKKLTASLKKKDAASLLTNLSAMSSLSQQLLNRKSRIIDMEKKIGTVIDKASALLPAL